LATIINTVPFKIELLVLSKTVKRRKLIRIRTSTTYYIRGGHYIFDAGGLREFLVLNIFLYSYISAGIFFSEVGGGVLEDFT
jgi:hypothetical protein